MPLPLVCLRKRLPSPLFVFRLPNVVLAAACVVCCSVHA